MAIVKKKRERFECHQDPQTGKIKCRSYREFEDGTRQELAGIDFEFDAECRGVATDMWENEPGALEKLEKKAVPRLKEKCKIVNKPKDY
ncbi:MAG: hypothetical protein ACTSR2_01550 [Candidatus Hodarchaeales archaeon]